MANSLQALGLRPFLRPLTNIRQIFLFKIYHIGQTNKYCKD